MDSKRYFVSRGTIRQFAAIFDALPLMLGAGVASAPRHLHDLADVGELAFQVLMLYTISICSLRGAARGSVLEPA